MDRAFRQYLKPLKLIFFTCGFVSRFSPREEHKETQFYHSVISRRERNLFYYKRRYKRVFVRYNFKKVLLLFPTNKYRRLASTEITSPVINAYFIGFDEILETHKKFMPHDLNQVRLLRLKPNILRDLFINISRIVGISCRTSNIFFK